MSPTGQPRNRLPVTATASDAGEVEVEEFPYGLGPPTGMLVLRYRASSTIAEFPESRNDFVHQVLWSPDGMLWVRRGASVAFAGQDQAIWVRRGATAEMAACGRQTVLRVCLREVPPVIDRQAAAVVEMSDRARSALVEVARHGVPEQVGLSARDVLLEEMSSGSMTDICHQAITEGPARAVARALVQDLGDNTSLAEWAARVNVSAKTLQRDFSRCFGESFSAWRTRTRLEASTAMLSRWTVTETAHRVGYSSPSAYVAAFTKAFGETPGHLAERRAGAAAS